MKIQVTPDQNFVSITDGTETCYYEFEESDKSCKSCILKGRCFTDGGLIVCTSNTRNDRRTGRYIPCEAYKFIQSMLKKDSAVPFDPALADIVLGG